MGYVRSTCFSPSTCYNANFLCHRATCSAVGLSMKSWNQIFNGLWCTMDWTGLRILSLTLSSKMCYEHSHSDEPKKVKWKGRRATNAPIPSAFVHWEKDLLHLKKGQPGNQQQMLKDAVFHITRLCSTKEDDSKKDCHSWYIAGGEKEFSKILEFWRRLMEAICLQSTNDAKTE